MIVPGNTIKLVEIGTSNAVVPEVQSQSPVVKAVRNIKKKNAGAYIRLQSTTSQTDKTNTQNESGNASSGRGVVYLSHIPDGFYEDEMRQYFSQFGRVTRVKLARSRKTGRSRGYAFIEFQYAEVAKVVAETMNNYLLYNRLLKASYVDKPYPAAFWSQQSYGPQNCPLARNRRIEVKRKNAILNPAKELAQQEKRRRQLAKTLNRLRDAGVDYTVEVKDQVQLTTGAEKKGKTFGGVKNAKQEKHTPKESVKVEDDPRKAQLVLLVDESDDEIEFNVPSYVIRKTLKRQSSSPSVEQSPKVKRGKHVKSGPPTPKVTLPSRENLTSPENENREQNLGSKQETRKSGRVSVIPKHISSGFHVTITPVKSKQKKSPGKESQESQLLLKYGEPSEQSSTPKFISTAFLRLQKSIESSTDKKSKNVNPSAENKVGLSLENNEMPAKVRRRSRNTPGSSVTVEHSPVADSIVKKVSPKADRQTGITPKQTTNNALSTNKRKTPKSAEIRDSGVKKTPVALGPEKTVVPKTNGKTPAPKAKLHELSPIQKFCSGDRKARMVKSRLKTPLGRKSFPLSKRSNIVQKPHSEGKKRMGLKTPSKTPVGRKSQNVTAASSPNLSPLFHSTAMKSNGKITKTFKHARKSLKLNE